MLLAQRLKAPLTTRGIYKIDLCFRHLRNIAVLHDFNVGDLGLGDASSRPRNNACQHRVATLVSSVPPLNREDNLSIQY